MKVIVHTTRDLTVGERTWNVFKKGMENTGAAPQFVVVTPADHKGELAFLEWAKKNGLKIVRTITKTS